MNDKQANLVINEARRLEMAAQEWGDKAASLEKQAINNRNEQHRLLKEARTLREGLTK
jgi:hypothetical protein